MLPILFGLIVLLTLIPSYSSFPLTYEDRFNLYWLLSGRALVFFIRRQSINWNEQIKNGQQAVGYNIDKKVILLTRLILSWIPFVNFAAFARKYCFQRSLVIGTPSYLSMVLVALAFIQNNQYVSYPVFLTLTSPDFLVFMYRWTIKYNFEK